MEDFSRVAYTELLPDERKGTCAIFITRSLAFIAEPGVSVEGMMTDNGSGYRSREFYILLGA